jgi:hypothetical protein
LNDPKEAYVNRKQWMIAGVLLTVVIVAAIMLLRNNEPDEPVVTGQETPVSLLAYCSEEGEKPCVVSFGLDADGNMLVNILLPELTFPNFRLEIMRGEATYEYDCRRVSTNLNNAYCIGAHLPPGESLHMMLLATRDDTLLSEGDLSIIGVVFPTLSVVSQTPEPTAPAMTEIFLTGSPTIFPTQVPELLPTKPKPTPNFTPTLPSYPSYPYP